MDINLTIDPDTIRMLAQRARAAGTPAEDTDNDGDIHEVEFSELTLNDAHGHGELAEDDSSDTYAEELSELIADLNNDEAAELVAITWIGRGDYDAGDWQEALAQAHARQIGPTAPYLARLPMLADHLEAGLDALEL